MFDHPHLKKCFLISSMDLLNLSVALCYSHMPGHWYSERLAPSFTSLPRSLRAALQPLISQAVPAPSHMQHTAFALTEFHVRAWDNHQQSRSLCSASPPPPRESTVPLSLVLAATLLGMHFTPASRITDKSIKKDKPYT